MSVLNDVEAVKLAGESVSLGQLLHVLKVADKWQFVDDAIAELMLVRAARQQGIHISDEQLQRAADVFRQVHGLQNAEDTHRWLGERHWTIDDFEQHVEARLLRNELAARVAGDEQVERHFAEHRRAYDRAVLSHIVVADEGLAEELKSQIVDDGADFAALARKHSTDEHSKDHGGFLGGTDRTSLNPAIEGAVFSASEGDVVGPVKTDRGFHLIKIERLILGKLDDEIARVIRDDLCRQWLQSERGTAQVEVPLYNLA